MAVMIERSMMENLSLVIVTDDREYGRALGQALLQLCSGMMIRIFRKEEFFLRRREYENSGESAVFLSSADMILWDGPEAEVSYGGRIILLTEKPSMAVSDHVEKRFCLYKYSQAQSIAAALFDIYSDLTGHHTVNVKRQQVRMLAFSSCCGGSGCTVAAMAAAQELCRFRGRRVLYLSFEETESTGDFMNVSPGVKGIGVYLYHLFKARDTGLRVPQGSGSEKNCPPVESYTIHDDFGVETFAPAAGRNPLRELSEVELDIFTASVIDSGRYDVIVMDIGSGLSAVDLACLGMAEKICFVNRSAGSTSREERYLQHLIFSCGESVIEKMIKVENMVSDDREEDHRDRADTAMLDTEVYLSRSSTFLQGGEIKRIFLDGRFGQDIKLLAEKLVEF